MPNTYFEERNSSLGNVRKGITRLAQDLEGKSVEKTMALIASEDFKRQLSEAARVVARAKQGGPHEAEEVKTVLLAYRDYLNKLIEKINDLPDADKAKYEDLKKLLEKQVAAINEIGEEKRYTEKWGKLGKPESSNNYRTAIALLQNTIFSQDLRDALAMVQPPVKPVVPPRPNAGGPTPTPATPAPATTPTAGVGTPKPATNTAPPSAATEQPQDGGGGNNKPVLTRWNPPQASPAPEINRTNKKWTRPPPSQQPAPTNAGGPPPPPSGPPPAQPAAKQKQPPAAGGPPPAPAPAVPKKPQGGGPPPPPVTTQPQPPAGGPPPAPAVATKQPQPPAGGPPTAKKLEPSRYDFLKSKQPSVPTPKQPTPAGGPPPPPSGPPPAQPAAKQKQPPAAGGPPPAPAPAVPKKPQGGGPPPPPVTTQPQPPAGGPPPAPAVATKQPQPPAGGPPTAKKLEPSRYDFLRDIIKPFEPLKRPESGDGKEPELTRRMTSATRPEPEPKKPESPLEITGEPGIKPENKEDEKSLVDAAETLRRAKVFRKQSSADSSLGKGDVKVSPTKSSRDVVEYALAKADKLYEGSKKQSNITTYKGDEEDKQTLFSGIKARGTEDRGDSLRGYIDFVSATGNVSGAITVDVAKGDGNSALQRTTTIINTGLVDSPEDKKRLRLAGVETAVAAQRQAGLERSVVKCPGNPERALDAAIDLLLHGRQVRFESSTQQEIESALSSMSPANQANQAKWELVKQCEAAIAARQFKGAAELVSQYMKTLQAEVENRNLGPEASQKALEQQREREQRFDSNRNLGDSRRGLTQALDNKSSVSAEFGGGTYPTKPDSEADASPPTTETPSKKPKPGTNN